jgi:DivIVA domain-containing protein
MQLPDGANSRALLIGTATYEHFPDVPEIHNNLRDLKSALVRHTGLPPEHCKTVLDPHDQVVVGAEVEEATKAATDLLLIYYSGHGLVASDGLLHLAHTRTSQPLAHWSGIPVKHLHHAIQVSRAKKKVLILDSCFSGRAAVLAGEESNILGQITANGTFTLTSSPANEPSLSFDGHGYTAFTGALLRLLENGSPRAGEMLTLGDVYVELLHHAQTNHLPEPKRLGTDTADGVPLARNRYAEPGGLTDEEEREVLQGMAQTTQLWKGVVQALVNSRGPSVDLLTARDIHNVQFKTVRLTPGYDEDEVDSFLDRVALALADPAEGPQRMQAADIRNTLFTTTRLREGYDMDEVDSFLDRVELEFQRRERSEPKTTWPRESGPAGGKAVAPRGGRA